MTCPPFFCLFQAMLAAEDTGAIRVETQNLPVVRTVKGGGGV